MKIRLLRRAFCLYVLITINLAVGVNAQPRSTGTNNANSASQVTIASLRSKQVSAELKFEKQLYRNKQIQADLYSYLSDGLKVYALVNTPNIKAPEDGFQVLIYGHGFHPQPRKYGFTSDGVSSRPGDYYRGIPERYAREGYLVVTPDYRGHNISEGFEYTQRDSLSSSYYALDVLHLLAAIPSLDKANAERIFYAGHSMGADVGLKTLLATSKIRAASLWSPAVASTAQRALYYGRFNDADKLAGVDSKKLTQYRSKVDQVYAALPIATSAADVDALNHLNYLTTPLLIHHARGDQSVPYQWSENLVIELHRLKKDFLFYAYDSNQHLFDGEDLERAFVRDLRFFNKY